MIPLWAVLSLASAVLVTAMPLVQERFKADGFALAFWVKVFMATMISPVVYHYGLPTDWMFYLIVGATAVLYSISDIFYFRAVPIVGSGIITRILPASVVVTFFLWFAVDHALVTTYMAQPWKMAAILIILCLFTFCATQVKKCDVSWQGVKLIWFVLFAACVGPILTKLCLRHATPEQGVGAYIFIQGLMTIPFLSIVYAVKKSVKKEVLFSRHSIRTAFIISAIAVIVLYMKTKAVQLVDNPSYVSMILFTDALWVLLVYKIIGRKEKANIIAGLGIVFCAFLVVVVKSL